MNSNVPTCSSDAGGTWICSLSQGTVTSHVVWNQNGTSTFSIPQSWNPTVMIDDAGQRTTLSPALSDMQISPAPVWLGPS